MSHRPPTAHLCFLSLRPRPSRAQTSPGTSGWAPSWLLPHGARALASYLLGGFLCTTWSSQARPPGGVPGGGATEQLELGVVVGGRGLGLTATSVTEVRFF